MSIYQEIVNFNDEFRLLTRPPVIINDSLNGSEAENEALKKQIFTYYESDTMSTVPRCPCGEVTGEFNVGVVCPICNKECESEAEKNLEPLMWMRAPHGVRRLINPTIWYLINAHFKVSGFELARWVADSSYKPTCKTPKEIAIILEQIPSRGYNFFHDNFDSLIDLFFTLKSSRNSKTSGKTIELRALIAKYRDAVFSDYIPLPNKSLLIVENDITTKYVDPLVIGAINAIQTIASIDQTNTPTGATSTVPKRSTDTLYQRNKEDRTIKAIHGLSVFVADYYGSALAKKQGLYRRQIFGTRVHFGFRTVITSITDKHNYDEIHIPWGAAIGTLRVHILNKLLRRGKTMREATNFFNQCIQAHYQEMEDILNELIAETPGGKGIPVILIRNPSLQRGSVVRLFITKIKTNLSEISTSLSTLVIRGLNADNPYVQRRNLS